MQLIRHTPTTAWPKGHNRTKGALFDRLFVVMVVVVVVVVLVGVGGDGGVVGSAARTTPTPQPPLPATAATSVDSVPVMSLNVHPEAGSGPRHLIAHGTREGPIVEVRIYKMHPQIANGRIRFAAVRTMKVAHIGAGPAWKETETQCRGCDEWVESGGGGRWSRGSREGGGCLWLRCMCTRSPFTLFESLLHRRQT